MENSEMTVNSIGDTDNIECKINEDDLQQLMEICKAEFPHIPDYFQLLVSYFMQ